MSPPKLSDEDLADVIAAFNAAGRSRIRAAEALGMHISKFNKRLSAAAKRGFDDHNPPAGFEIAHLSETRDAQGNLKSRSVSSRPEPGEVLQVPPGQKLAGLSALVDQDYRVKLKWVKLKEGQRDPADILETMGEVAASKVKPIEPIAPPTTAQADLFSLIPVADLHGGQLSYGRETGMDRDLKIATAELEQTIRDVVARSAPAQEAAFVFMGDTFHADDTTARTPASKHVLDVDSRHQKVVWDVCDAAIECVRLLASHHKTLHVRVLPGNHDPHASQALALGLFHAFKETPHVLVSKDMSAWWFHQWGVNMLGAHHGDKLKPAQMPGKAATLMPAMWAATKYRYLFHGHFHRRTVIEGDGALVMGLPAMTSPDAYAAGGGMTSARGLTVFEFHKHRGPLGSIDRLSPPVTLEDRE